MSADLVLSVLSIACLLLVLLTAPYWAEEV